MKKDLKGIAVIALFYICLQFVGITCPIKFITGVSCAGCGMTRAWLSFFRLDIQGAFRYHPLFLLAIPLVLIFIFYERIPKKISTSILCVIAVSMLICYGIRMKDPNDMVVVFQPGQGIFFKVLHFLKNMKQMIPDYNRFRGLI